MQANQGKNAEIIPDKNCRHCEGTGKTFAFTDFTIIKLNNGLRIKSNKLESIPCPCLHPKPDNSSSNAERNE